MQKNKNYTIDKKTRKATFLPNNNTALVHGGYSKKMSKALVDSLLDTDLGFEVGILKGQLSNIATLGEQAIKDLTDKGESTLALQLALSCADSTSRLIPQIQKALESNLSNDIGTDEQILKIRNKWLKKLRADECSAIELAYQFETKHLGGLPAYVQKQIDNELQKLEPDTVPELHTREELKQKLDDYWQSAKSEKQQINERKLNITEEKTRINDQFFGGNNDKN